MAEVFLTDAQALAVLDTILSPGLPIPAVDGPNLYMLPRLFARIARALAAAAACEVFKDDSGALKVGVRPGSLWSGTAVVAYAGGVGTVVNNALNYVYLIADGTLTINQAAFPDPAVTPHWPLAIVAVGTASGAGVSGAFAIADIADVRSRSVMSLVKP